MLRKTIDTIKIAVKAAIMTTSLLISPLNASWRDTMSAMRTAYQAASASPSTEGRSNEEIALTVAFAFLIPNALPGPFKNELLKMSLEQKKEIIGSLFKTTTAIALKCTGAGLREGSEDFTGAFGQLFNDFLASMGGEGLGGAGADSFSAGIGEFLRKLGDGAGAGLDDAWASIAGRLPNMGINAGAGLEGAANGWFGGVDNASARGVGSATRTLRDIGARVAPAAQDLLQELGNAPLRGFSWAAITSSPHILTGSAVFGAALFTVWYSPKLMYAFLEKKMFTPTVLRELPKRKIPLTDKTFVGKPQMIKKLKSVTNLLKNAKKMNKDALHLLFVGPPGVGKTEFCRFLADETGIKTFLFNMKNLPDGQKGIDLFTKIDTRRRGNRFKSPCIMVIDEADTIIMSRKTNSHKHSEDSQAKLNAILQATGSEEDSFVGCYIFITNTPECVDEAILDRSLVVKFEDLSPEAKIKLFTSKMYKAEQNKSMKLDKDVTEKVLAELISEASLDQENKLTDAENEAETIRRGLLGIRSGRGISKFCKYLTFCNSQTNVSKKTLWECKKDFMTFMADEIEYSERLQVEQKRLSQIGTTNIPQAAREDYQATTAVAA